MRNRPAPRVRDGAKCWGCGGSAAAAREGSHDDAAPIPTHAGERRGDGAQQLDEPRDHLVSLSVLGSAARNGRKRSSHAFTPGRAMTRVTPAETTSMPPRAPVAVAGSPFV